VRFMDKPELETMLPRDSLIGKVVETRIIAGKQ